MAAANNGDIYQSTYKGWYSVRDEAYFDEDELTDGEGGKKLAPSGAEATWVEEASYFFRLSAYQDRLLKLYEEQPDFIAPKERRNEIVCVRQARPAGRLDLPHDLRLGHPGAGRAGPRDVCLGRRADQLHHRRRLSRRQGRAVPEVLAGRPPRHRQGHHPLPHRLLAGLPDERRAAGAEARLRPRLPDVRRQEDVEVARQRRRSVRARRGIRRRSGPLLLPARNLVGAGRRLGPREVHPPQQRRPRQQFRQPRAALAVDDRQEFRRARCRRGRPTRPTTRSSPRRSPPSSGCSRRWSPSRSTRRRPSWSRR